MGRYRSSLRLVGGALVLGLGAASAGWAQNQPPDLGNNQGLIVRDHSLGVGQGEPVRDGIDPRGQAASYLITPELGERSGRNLFHSFEHFGIGADEVATFVGPDPIDGPQSVGNVLTRVTGGSESSIAGTLRSTIPGADVWLMNPHGVVFGAGATLDVQGSFHATTADEVRFGPGEAAFAAAPPAGEVLSTASPAAFGFLGASPAQITVTGTTLAVPAARMLRLIGGDPLSDDGSSGVSMDAATLNAPGGRVDLASVRSAGQVAFGGTAAEPVLDVASFSQLGDLSIRNNSLVTTRRLPDAVSGTIIARAERITASGSVFSSTTDATDAEQDHPGLAVDLHARGPITLDNSSVAASTTGAGDAGDIRIRAGSLAVTGPVGRNVSSLARGAGNGGDVTVEAGSLRVSGGASLFTLVASSSPGGQATGRGGDVSVGVTGSMEVSAGSFVGTQTGTTSASGGPAGALTVTAETLTVDGGSLEQRVFGASEDGKPVNITVGSLRISGDGGVLSSTDPNQVRPGEGMAGPLTIDARGDVEVVGSGSFLGTNTTTPAAGAALSITAGRLVVKRAEGDREDALPAIVGAFTSGGAGGEARIDAQQIEIRDGGQISTPTFGPGRGGDLTIVATKSLSVGGESGGIFVSMGNGTTGAGGDLVIDAPLFEVTGGARVGTFSFEGNVDPGDADADALRDVGDVRITAGSVRVTDRGDIRSATFATGENGPASNAGDVFLAADLLEVTTRGSIFADSRGPGQGGRLEVKAREVRLLDGGILSAGAASQVDPTRGRGDAGSVLVEAGSVLVSGFDPRPIVIDGESTFAVSAIASQAFPNAGNGGHIHLIADRIELRDGGGIKAETFGPGAGGDIVVQGGELSISGVNQSLRALLLGGIQGRDPQGALESASARISARTDPFFLGSGATGRAGNVRIETVSLEIADGGRVEALSTGPGDGGDVSIDVDRLRLAGSDGGEGLAQILAGSFSATTPAGASGHVSILAGRSFESRNGVVSTLGRRAAGGNLRIEAEDIRLLGGGGISARSQGDFDAGNITLIAGHEFVAQSALVTTQADRADGGNIEIRAGDLILLRDARVTATVLGGEGRGGNVTLDPPFVVLDGATMIANALDGPGGNIRIVARALFASPDSVLQASSATNIQGTIEINAPDVDLAGTLATLPTSFLDAARLVRERCSATEEPGGSFVVRGRGGLPPGPDAVLSARVPSAPHEEAAGATRSVAPRAERLGTSGGCGAGARHAQP